MSCMRRDNRRLVVIASAQSRLGWICVPHVFRIHLMANIAHPRRYSRLSSQLSLFLAVRRRDITMMGKSADAHGSEK